MCGGSGGGLAVTTFSFFYSPFSLSLPCKTCCPIRKSIFSSYFVMVFDIILLFSIVSFLSWFFYKLYFFLIHHWLKCYFSSYFVLVSCLILTFFWVFFISFVKCLIFSILPFNQLILFYLYFSYLSFGSHSFILLFLFYFEVFYQILFFNFIIWHWNVNFPLILFWFQFWSSLFWYWVFVLGSFVKCLIFFIEFHPLINKCYLQKSLKKKHLVLVLLHCFFFCAFIKLIFFLIFIF